MPFQLGGSTSKMAIHRCTLFFTLAVLRTHAVRNASNHIFPSFVHALELSIQSVVVILPGRFHQCVPFVAALSCCGVVAGRVTGHASRGLTFVWTIARCLLGDAPYQFSHVSMVIYNVNGCELAKTSRALSRALSRASHDNPNSS